MTGAGESTSMAQGDKVPEVAKEGLGQSVAQLTPAPASMPQPETPLEGTHTVSTRMEGVPSGLVCPMKLHRPQLQLHIFTFREKNNQRERFIAFYDTEPLPPPVFQREG